MLVDTSTDWGRRIITGVVNYVREHERWQLFIVPAGSEEHLTLPKGWRGDGVIARVNTEEIARHLKSKRIPVVNVSGVDLDVPPFPRVTNDARKVAQMAIDYFLERGFRHFAYISPIGLQYVAAQRGAFVDAAEKAGCRCAVHSLKTYHDPHTADWNMDIERLGTWLAAQPKPLAILTWSGGREVVYACQQAGLRVPEDVALLSGADDFLCEISQVPISAVRAACERIGYEAAAKLDRIMHGGTLRESCVFIPPVGVITRQSTDTLAITDRAVIRAIKFIRENSGKPVQVREVANIAGVSRRVLERRFKKVLGSTPADHVRHSHLERAKQLLNDTDLPMSDIAESSGFGSSAYMSYIFRKELGISPLSYRREGRGIRSPQNGAPSSNKR